MELLGRSAIITGANQGLGRAIATSFVRAGASVLLVARGEDLLRQVREELAKSIVAPGQRVLHFRGDVSRPEDCTATSDYARAQFGRVTGLVNNAGVYGPMGCIEDVDWTEWVEAMHINLFGTVLMCRAVIPMMREQGYGKIVNLSGGGATGPLPRISAYAASKAAVVRLTETFAEELLEAHVDVNAIAPGALNTRLLDEVLAAGPDKVGAEFYARAVRQKQDGGVALTHGADLAVFLASSASDGITGRLISALWDDWARWPQHLPELESSDVYKLRRITGRERGFSWGDK